MSDLILETRVNPDHILHLPTDLPVNARIRIHIERLDDDTANKSFQARTPLGLRLSQLRMANLASGGRLLTPDELDTELHERRGGVSSE